MDDDLRALLGDDDDDDLFGAFDEPVTDEGPADDSLFSDDLFGEAPQQDEPAWQSGPETAAVAATPEPPQEEQKQKPKKEKKKKKKRGNFLGMTPFQRMILSIFFFLDVLVIGFLLLYALGKISF